MAPGFVWTRRLTVASAIVILSLAGHAGSGRGIPHVTGLLVALAVALGVTVAVRPGMSSARLALVVLGGEVLLHSIFAMTETHGAGSGGGHHGLVPSGSMVLGHLLASVLAFGALVHGDRILNSWAAFLTAPLGQFSLFVPQPRGCGPSIPTSAAAHWHLALLAHRSNSWRGPPLGMLA